MVLLLGKPTWLIIIGHKLIQNIEIVSILIRSLSMPLSEKEKWMKGLADQHLFFYLDSNDTIVLIDITDYETVTEMRC